MKLVKKQLWVPLFMILLVSTIMLAIVPMINVTSASPGTYFYVDPQEVRDVSSGNTFLINISVNEAPETYTWEIYISWDPTLLELDQIIWDPYLAAWVGVMEGDFLHRGGWDPDWGEWFKNYTTTFWYDPLASANVEGEIRVGCSLKGDVPWASGDGWLATLGFRVKAVGSSVLNLFDTRLWDYMLAGSPAYTYHSNLDGFFYNTLFHDIAVDNVAPDVTEVYEAQSVAISVTVRNEGNYSETSETFNVTVYADITAYEYTYDPVGRLIKTTAVVGDEIIVGTQTVTDPLAPGATTTLTFTWDTTEAELNGTYTISAEVKGDDDTRDNLFIDGTVHVKIMGDVNGDGTVDGSDLTRMAVAYGSELGDTNWDEECDFNGDGKVDASDLFDLGKNYGRSV